MDSVISNRYAKALFSLAKKESVLKEILPSYVVEAEPDIAGSAIEEF